MYKNLRFVYITTPTKEEAKKIGRILVEEKLAACVNIVDEMESIYWWEGEVQQATECILIAKSHYSRAKQLGKRVKEMHSYDCPCIVSMTIAEDEGNPEYLKWLEETTKQPFNL
ncbi:MAG: divalent-cation tolerance protein CutA [Balneolaceae bacterium]|nr:divalent-cation tolerance protein CutA [Balneolaceae bacterium]